MKLTAYVIKPEDPPWIIEPASIPRVWMEQTNVGFAYRCLPLTMANAMGWIIRCPVTFWADWNGQVLHDNSIRLGFQETTYSWWKVIQSHFGLGIITFQLPWLFHTDEESVGLLARGLPNYYKPNCHALEGFVETWWCPFTFTMNWKIIAPNTPVLFEKGDPICFILQPCHPGVAEETEPEVRPLADNPRLLKEFMEWRRKRNDFNVSTLRTAHDWQRFYQKAEGCPHVQLHTHRTSIKIKEFTHAPVPDKAAPSSSSSGEGDG